MKTHAERVTEVVKEWFTKYMHPSCEDLIPRITALLASVEAEARKDERDLLCRIDCSGCAAESPLIGDTRDHKNGVHCTTWRYRDERFRELYSELRNEDDRARADRGTE